MNKKVSIIIPCFNGERFIDRCLHSIEIQNYPHIEVVVVNDGSIDQSESKILEWKEVLENKKISLIYIKQKNQANKNNNRKKYFGAVFFQKNNHILPIKRCRALL